MHTNRHKLEQKVLAPMYYDGFELFRRAIVEHEDEAWTTIAVRYRPMMIAWAARCPAVHATGEYCEDLAGQAFARAWRALTPERFARFPSLAALLAYLRTCVSATVIDAARARSAYVRAVERLGNTSEQADYALFARLEREELWQLVLSLTITEAERVVIRERFVYGHAPRIIQARHPALFADVTVVYSTIHNLCDRLRRHKDLARIYAEHLGG